jgi:hypothetical protein
VEDEGSKRRDIMILLADEAPYLLLGLSIRLQEHCQLPAHRLIEGSQS